MNTFSEPFTPVFLERLEELLPPLLSASRWYRAKTRNIQHVSVHDVIALHEGFFLVVIDIEYREKDTDRYVLPMEIPCLATGAEEALGIDALGNPLFRDALLKAVAGNITVDGAAGQLVASHTSAFQPNAEPIESFVSGAEQSNTSIIYRGHFIFKLFRKIEPGVNPDLEIGRFLTEHNFRHTPALLGSLEYREESVSYSAGILQQFVPNKGDAWKYTLDELSAFFERAATAPESPELLGGYLASARLLGVRTAEMHTALASSNPASSNEADFSPETFAGANARELHREMLVQAGVVFALLRQKLPSLDAANAELARDVLALEVRILSCFALFDGSTAVSAVRIRHHGDYHLGQVLYTGDDFMIIDFEGEPARPLAERRSKGLALRDVAGMLRSFDYAAHAAPEAQGKNEVWAAVWLARVNAAYRQAYFEAAVNQPYVSLDPAENKLVLDAFLLHKALYEVAYELNNRPDWVRIPLRGILNLFPRVQTS